MQGEHITPMYNTQFPLSQTRKGKCQTRPFPLSVNILDLLNWANPRRNSAQYPPQFRQRHPQLWQQRQTHSYEHRRVGLIWDTTSYLTPSWNVLPWNINRTQKHAVLTCLCKRSHIHTPAHNNLLNWLRSISSSESGSNSLEEMSSWQAAVSITIRAATLQKPALIDLGWGFMPDQRIPNCHGMGGGKR